MPAWSAPLQARWAALSAREQGGVRLAALALAALLLWSLALAPALRTLRAAPERNAALAAQLEHMQALQARARQLQALPAPAPQEQQRTLQAAAARLGNSASLQLGPEQATLSLRRLDAQVLADWLAGDALAGIGPSAAHLQRDAGNGAPSWSGVLVFTLVPAAGAR